MDSSVIPILMSSRPLDYILRLEAPTVGFANLLPLVGVVVLGWNFYGHALELFGTPDWATFLGIVVAIWAVQIVGGVAATLPVRTH